MKMKGVVIATAVAATLVVAGCSKPRPMPHGHPSQAGHSGKLGKMGGNSCKANKCSPNGCKGR